MGDRVGRKYTFLITLSGMALGTGAIGLIPTFEQIGLGCTVPFANGAWRDCSRGWAPITAATA
jgi:MFS family permease